MKKNKYFTALFLFSLLFFSGCFKKPEMINIQKVNIQKVNGDTLSIGIDVLILNPNNYQLKADNVALTFKVEKELLGYATINSKLILPPKSKKRISLQTDLLLPNISKKIPYLIKKDSFPVNIKIKAEFTSLKIPLTSKTTQYFKTKEFINNLITESDTDNDIKIKRVDILETKLDSTKFKLILGFTNRLPFDYYIKKINTKIYSDKSKSKLMGTSRVSKKLRLKKGSQIELPIEIAISNIESIKGLFANILKKKKTVFFVSKIKIAIGKYNFAVPVEMEFEITKNIVF